MNYETRPPRRGLMPPMSADFESSIARVEYSVLTSADCKLAWKIFSDTSLWSRFSDLYGAIRWQGPAWTPGSRLRIDIGEPINATVDRVITICMPPHNVAWINHVRGYTMEQWVSFDPYQGGGTKVSTWIEVTGAEISQRGGEDIKYLKTVLVSWFTRFAAECDRAARVL
jgi:hypothetical protein